MTSVRRKIKRASPIPRGRRPAGTLFGGPRDGTPPGALTDFGCPDCRGVLAVAEDGHKGHLTFTCRVGHAFSGESLIAVKEEQLEGALWSAVEVYEEIVLLHQEMAERVRRLGGTVVAASYVERAGRAVGLIAELRDVIARDGPATGAPPKPPRPGSGA